MRTIAGRLVVPNSNVTDMMEDHRHKTRRIICQFDDQHRVNQTVFLNIRGIKHVRSCVMKHARNASLLDSL